MCKGLNQDGFTLNVEHHFINCLDDEYVKKLEKLQNPSKKAKMSINKLSVDLETKEQDGQNDR